MKSMIIVFKIDTDTHKYDFSTLPMQFSKRFYEYIKTLKDGRKNKDSHLRSICTRFFTHTAPYFSDRGLDSFAEIGIEEKQLFIVYLNTIKSKYTGKLLSKSTKRHIFSATKNYFAWLAYNYPNESPNMRLFSPNPYSKGQNSDLKTKVIDEIVMKQIKNALRDEKNFYVKTFLAVAIYLGLRRGDILELRFDCLIEDSDKQGAYLIHYYNHKDDKWKKKPIPKNCSSVVIALKLLIEHTQVIREESGQDKLFIWRVSSSAYGKVGSIQRYNAENPRAWISSFIKRHNIMDAMGRVPKIQAHMFRHTLLTSMDEAGLDLEYAQHMADHAHPSTTRRYYIHSRDETYNKEMDILDKLVESITFAESISVIDDELFQKNRTSLRLNDGYCQDTKMVTVDEYICEHYQKQGNCYGCSKMVTVPEFLPDFYVELKELEKELEEKRQYGENVLRQINFRIDMIQILIKRLEALGGVEI